MNALQKLTQIVLLIFSTGILSAADRDYSPKWASAKPIRVITHSSGDGESLVKAVAALKPGDQLVIKAGTYSVSRMWDIQVSGTAQAPIWIVAEEGAKVILTRPDARQNVLNIGQGGPVRFLCLRGIEITGGSHGLRLGKCSDVWIDQCHIHHTGEVCLSANSADTSRLHLTRNHIHHGGGHAEGMYLGANNGQYIMSESVIAQNHIHDCRGDQGDGIEVKQGSWGNLIAENDIHDTNYPCITVYGTAGKPVNIIERNLCRRSNDNVLQVQGEAIVRNNIIIGGAGAGLASTDHQGKSINLQVLHNTIINSGHSFSGSSWNGRKGMILANNVLYSKDKNAINFPNGGNGAIISGNIVVGAGPKIGTSPGRGVQDFADVSWDALNFNAKPVADAPFLKADRKYLIEIDFKGKPRSQPISGAITP
jgi:hypothetical protein